MSKLRASRERDERGFTLIELLVVILIIAILAAIAIPVFLRQREKGWVAQTESSLVNARNSIEAFGTGNQGSYTGIEDAGALADAGYNETDTVTLTVQVTDDGNAWCAQGDHESLDAMYAVSSESGKPQTGTCVSGVFTAPAL